MQEAVVVGRVKRHHVILCIFCRGCGRENGRECCLFRREVLMLTVSFNEGKSVRDSHMPFCWSTVEKCDF